ncbi:hypothetical protein [Bradyrhizobium sp. DOA1]|uniref:hypothetical protein n=1 Tax=Bradyrhizobium sp. DOA1 TaxID=1126616 RepID=UPI0012E7CA18|nr:hypothetical protein [Bradyrhizobium sp. DOA1]
MYSYFLNRSFTLQPRYCFSFGITGKWDINLAHNGYLGDGSNASAGALSPNTHLPGLVAAESNHYSASTPNEAQCAKSGLLIARQTGKRVPEIGFVLGQTLRPDRVARLGRLGHQRAHRPLRLHRKLTLRTETSIAAPLGEIAGETSRQHLCSTAWKATEGVFESLSRSAISRLSKRAFRAIED